jgi:hypothetical protein
MRINVLSVIIITQLISIALLDDTTTPKPKTSYHVDIPTEDDPIEDDKRAKTHHHIYIKNIFNLFACWDDWDSLDDCVIIQNFK